jgi:regulator of protease activity HflC (stomatin/prohibitin superfamily)
LESQMEKYGFEIESTQIKDIDPDAKVKEAMNSVQASQRNREAAANNAEAGKITLVKAAEARKDADILHGQGIAGERAEIAKGFAQAIKTLKDADPTVTEEEINKFLLSAQYLDTMKDIGANGKNSVVFLPNSPAGMHEIMGSLMGSKIVSNGQESSEKKY